MCGEQAMEGAMAGLQEVQVESMRRLTAGLTDAIGEAQLTLQVGYHPLASSDSKCSRLQEGHHVPNLHAETPPRNPWIGISHCPSEPPSNLQVVSHGEHPGCLGWNVKCLALQEGIVLAC